MKKLLCVALILCLAGCVPIGIKGSNLPMGMAPVDAAR
jgi:hypothetical protein